MSTPDFSDDLTNQLNDAAHGVDGGDTATVLADVHATARRRRRRGRAAAGVVAAGALVASGAVVANLASSDGTDELILSAPATDVENTTNDSEVPADTASTGDAPAPTVDAESGDAPSADDQPLVVDPTVVADAPGVASFPVRGAEVDYTGDRLSEEDMINGGPTQLLAWNDGFLSITTVSQPQSLPAELPPEIAEQFPQEVLDLFPDGLPPTIEEATQILQDAGLFEVVSEIVLANADVSDAIYAQPVLTVSSARFSTDGETWEDIESAIPSEALRGRELISSGDRVASVSIEGDSMIVRSSTDLVNWDEQVIAVPERPADRPDFITYDVYPGDLVVNGDRWIAELSTFGEFDMSMLPDGPLSEEIRAGRAGYGFGEDGVEFMIDNEPDGSRLPDDEVQTRIVTWEELGVDAAPDMQSLFTRVRYTATWGGESQDVTPASDEDSGQIVAVDDGFFEFGASVRFSADGVDWEDVDAPFSGHLNWSVATGRGLLVSASDQFGRQATFALDRSDSTWSEVDVADLPQDSFSENSSPGVLLLTSFGDPFRDLVATNVTVAEVDGYRFEQRFEQATGDQAYTVTNIESGEVVSTETLTRDDEFGVDFEFLEQVSDGDDPGIRLLDPETGEVLVTVPYDVITWTNLGPDGEVLDDADLSGEFSQSEQQSWVVAPSADGVIVQALSAADRSMAFPVGAASNGEYALVSFSDGTFARIALT